MPVVTESKILENRKLADGVFVIELPDLGGGTRYVLTINRKFEIQTLGDISRAISELSHNIMSEMMKPL